MAKAYSADMRARVIGRVESGASRREAAENYEVSPSTAVNWKQGDDVIIAGSVTDDDAKKLFPQGWKSPKPYIRIVPQPK